MVWLFVNPVGLVLAITNGQMAVSAQETLIVQALATHNGIFAAEQLVASCAASTKFLLVALWVVMRLLCIITAILAINTIVASSAFETEPVHWPSLQRDVSVHLVADNTPSAELLLIAARVIVGLGSLISLVTALNGLAAVLALEALIVQAFLAHNSVLATEQLMAS